MKTKGGREMNPTDAYRKQARKREIKRNRAERHYIREAFNKKTQAQSLKEELEQLIAVEQNGGELNKLQKLRKKVVMEAYEAAIRRQKEDELRKRQAEEEGTQLHAGLSSVPLPKPPPLPAGPKPGLPPPPAAPPLPAGPAPGAAGGVLPPPPGPPPGAAPAPAANGSSAPILPPPPGPPPSSAAAALLPPPPGPPPAAAFGVLPPPTGPPPGAWLPPPAMPPPAAAAAGGILPPPAMPPPAAPAASILPPPSMPPPGQPSSSILPPPPSNTVSAAAAVTKQATGLKAGGTTITGASTVAKRPLAHKDKALTSMVPASVLVRREAAAAATAAADGKTRKVDLSAEVQVGPGFGLAPVQKSAVGGRAGASKLSQQLQQPQEQGKWSSVVQTFVAPAVQAKAAAGGGNRPAVNVDQKLADFMDSLKDLGAFE